MPMKREFNIDGSQSLTPDILRSYPNEYFVETGTFKGGGIRAAWEAGFSRILSVEKNPQLYWNAKLHFSSASEVQIFYGDSGDILGDVLSHVDEPATIFLDAHRRWHEEVTKVPLEKELEAIRNHPIKTHTILIDDIMYADSMIDDWMDVNTDKLMFWLLEINDYYQFDYIDGKNIPKSILVARLDDTSI